MITDPGFYAVSVPAVLLLGISKSGFGAGFGSLAVPMMAMAVTVPEAAAILMPVLLLMDLLGMAAFRKDFDLKLLRFLLPWGLVGIVVGTLLF
nr:sulfite exporter TauE/SafE family protein [Burkholderiaceae bacterium]